MKVIFILGTICLMALPAKMEPFRLPSVFPHPAFPSHHFPRPNSHHSGPVCGVLNGYYKTFHSLQEFLDYNKNGYSFTFYCNGPCPPSHYPCSQVYEPVCATDLRTAKTFSSPCALAEESYKSGITWVKIADGPCPSPSITTTSTTTTTTTTTKAPTTAEEPTTEEVTTKEVTSTEEDTTPEPSTSEPTTPEPSTSEPTTPEPSTLEPTTPEPSAPESTTPVPTTTPEVPSPEETTSVVTALPEEDDEPCQPSLPVGVLAPSVQAGPIISFRNNVDNNYGIYAEGNVYNTAPCNNKQNCNTKG
ncbi:salivary glue protein Sgs-3-like [Musca vetustissima]|uniref:salivary glue protein Sgs-3-like n=1 Tax=Musca vetustissima TaxID=27455 RepID=UPI002AB78585|nr:salivary glue protein Sgs-3-like [Musca vetustissima]